MQRRSFIGAIIAAMTGGRFQPKGCHPVTVKTSDTFQQRYCAGWNAVSKLLEEPDQVSALIRKRWQPSREVALAHEEATRWLDYAPYWAPDRRPRA